MSVLYSIYYIICIVQYLVSNIYRKHWENQLPNYVKRQSSPNTTVLWYYGGIVETAVVICLALCVYTLILSSI